MTGNTARYLGWDKANMNTIKISKYYQIQIYLRRDKSMNSCELQSNMGNERHNNTRLMWVHKQIDTAIYMVSISNVI